MSGIGEQQTALRKQIENAYVEITHIMTDVMQKIQTFTAQHLARAQLSYNTPAVTNTQLQAAVSDTQKQKQEEQKKQQQKKIGNMVRLDQSNRSNNPGSIPTVTPSSSPQKVGQYLNAVHQQVQNNNNLIQLQNTPQATQPTPPPPAVGSQPQPASPQPQPTSPRPSNNSLPQNTPQQLTQNNIQKMNEKQQILLSEELKLMNIYKEQQTLAAINQQALNEQESRQLKEIDDELNNAQQQLIEVQQKQQQLTSMQNENAPTPNAQEDVVNVSENDQKDEEDKAETEGKLTEDEENMEATEQAEDRAMDQMIAEEEDSEDQEQQPQSLWEKFKDPFNTKPSK